MAALTNEDLERFLSLYPDEFISFQEALNCALKYRNDKDKFINLLNKEKNNRLSILANIPDMFLDIEVPVMYSISSKTFEFNVPLFLTSLVAGFDSDKHKLDIKEVAKEPTLYYEGNVEEYLLKIKEKLRCEKLKYNEMIRNDRFLLPQMRENAIYIRNNINFLYRNLDLIVSILSKPLNSLIESYLDDEKLLFLITYMCFSKADLEFDKDVTYDKKCLPFLEGYRVYLKEKLEEDPKFNIYFTDYFDNKKISISTKYYLETIDEICKEYPSFKKDIDIVDETIDFKEICKDFYRQKRINKIRKNISVSWEFMPKGEGESKQIYSRTISNSTSKKESYATNGEELLKDKEKFFNSLPYVATFNGINHFEGYVAYAFLNGKVVFEKFYERVKGGLKPATGNAIYIMDIEDFSSLSCLDKTELRKFKDKVKPKYHTKTFQQRVLKEINTPAYNDDVLDYIDSLVSKAKEDKYERVYKK